MQSRAALSDFSNRLQRIIYAQPAALPDSQFTELALELFALQREFNEPYGKLCVARRISPELQLQNWTDIPAVPTSAFKDLELSCLSATDRATVFHSSGTTQHQPSRHFHNRESLAVYEASLVAAFSRRLDISNSQTIISLTPRREFAPNSSLVYMFETFRERFGNDASAFVGKIDGDGGWALNVDAAYQTLQRASAVGKPVLILGTAFLYVHLLDFLKNGNLRFKLPPGSHVLETGGYKGRSRTMPRDELHRSIHERLGINSTDIICEYGMSELSSQAYDRPEGIAPSTPNSPIYNPKGIESFSPGLRDWPVRLGPSYPGFEPLKGHNPERVASDFDRIFHFPPWSRVQIISPETGREVNEGETGLIRVFDLANVFSVMAIQTEDLGVRRGDGFELIGRAELAEPRGCSLMAV